MCPTDPVCPQYVFIESLFGNVLATVTFLYLHGSTYYSDQIHL